VVRVYSEVPRAFDREDVQALQHFANLAAIAIDNARAWRILQDVDRERSRFVRILAHELRSPLAAILINLGVILDGYVGDVPEKIAQLLERARQRGNLLLDLTNDLLALASGRETTAERTRERLSLAEIAQQSIHDLRGQAQSKSIQLKLHTGEGPLDLLGDRDQLERLMDNLVNNAVKYTLDGGRVTVSLHGEEGSVELVVEDTGIGIPQAAQDRLFEEFFRAENAKRLTEQGTGLGLSIVRRIVEDHRGKIAVESEEGRGTRITVVFPRDSQRLAGQGHADAEVNS
jgi:signal transduction histidine kinase